MIVWGLFRATGVFAATVIGAVVFVVFTGLATLDIGRDTRALRMLGFFWVAPVQVAIVVLASVSGVWLAYGERAAAVASEDAEIPLLR